LRIVKKKPIEAGRSIEEPRSFSAVPTASAM
jgi:hypothetical protein